MVFKSLADLDKCAANYKYDTGYCLEPLQKYAKANPKELFAIGKRARLQFQHWVALQFFEPALGTSPAAEKCADEDVSLAIISGLSQPAENPPNGIARRLLSGACFPAVKAAVEKEIRASNGEGYLPQHACPRSTGRKHLAMALNTGHKLTANAGIQSLFAMLATRTIGFMCLGFGMDLA